MQHNALMVKPLRTLSLLVMSGFYIFAGLMHFKKPEMYLKIMPPFLPAHELLVRISGVAESTLGLALLIPSLRKKASIGIIALLIAIFPANIYMLMLGGEKFGLPQWVLWVRLPLQGVLIYWAAWQGSLLKPAKSLHPNGILSSDL